MKKLGMVTLGLAAFVIGMSVNNFAMSDVPPSYKIAVVDVPKVVNSSSQVAALKKEQQAKAQEIVKFVEKARKDVAATTDANKKKALEDKYNKELNKKKADMDKNYATKLSAIDANISNKINEQAKAGNYNIVLAKGVVLYGGEDITDTIIKAVK